ncbi:5'-3' exonuclease H3TH domain-containing protein [Klebsiella pneumoniae]|nr:flap endonuclease Xni [Klebsiella pneumoniae]
MAVHLLIVDALNLIRRIHAVQGSPCVDTCLHALEQLIVHSQPTHAVAVFDDEDRAHGWRHQRLPEYKAGRAPMPETLVAEMPTLRAAFEQRGIRCWASPGSEADDLAATLAVKVAQAGIGPKSAAQLLNEFQDLEGLYARLAEVPEKWRKKLAAHQEMAFTCREVARLQTDLQLDGNLQQLRLTR